MRVILVMVGIVLGALISNILIRAEEIYGFESKADTFSAKVIDLQYTDFVSIMFTGATVILAGLAIMITVVAFYTFREIKNEASRKAEKAAEDKIKELEKSMQEQAEAAVEEMILKGNVDDKLDDRIRNLLSSEQLNDLVTRYQQATKSASIGGMNELEEEFDPEDDGER